MSSPQTSVAPELLQDSLNSPTVDEDPEEHKKRRGHAEIQLTDQTNLLSTKKIVLTFFGLSFCVFVSTLDSVIVTAALSTIGRYFNAGAVVSWVPSAYLLTSTRLVQSYKGIDVTTHSVVAFFLFMDASLISWAVRLL